MIIDNRLVLNVTTREASEPENMYRLVSIQNEYCLGVFERCGRRYPTQARFPHLPAWS